MSTFTTSQKIEPKLNNRELGELRLKKLKEAQDNGAIGLAKDRGSLAELVGIPKDKPTAATWVGRLVRNGTVSETLIGFSPDTHKPEYEYHYSPNKTANKPKNIPTAREKMLLWIQNNIIDCKDTTYKQLAERSLIPGLTTSQRRSCLYALVRQDYIRVKEGEHGNKTKKSFYINYLNDKLPPSILENIPNTTREELMEEPTLKQTPETSVTIPLDIEVLKQGFQLTLNINFTLNK